MRRRARKLSPEEQRRIEKENETRHRAAMATFYEKLKDFVPSGRPPKMFCTTCRRSMFNDGVPLFRRGAQFFCDEHLSVKESANA